MKVWFTKGFTQLGAVTIALLTYGSVIAQDDNTAGEGLEQKVDSVLQLMTLSDKVGQLNQLRGMKLIKNNDLPADVKIDIVEEVRNGRVGSFLNVGGIDDKRTLQTIAVNESPAKIPLIFAQDVIHGFKTTFPVPLAEAASWDLEAIKRSAEIAALEASSSGVMWTFAPMVDISWDARMGRVVEGAGEDPYLGSQIAVARVTGFQGDDLADSHTILACAKHFAGYGQVLAGRDYNQTRISKRFLHDYILPPFKAANDAGVATVMNGFNDFDGVPVSASKYLLRDVLKGEWGFKGFTVSDWNSFAEMIKWRYAKNRKHAAELAIKAGSDVDMISLVTIENLEALVREGSVPVSIVDDAVGRILKLKFRLGLFDDPYHYFTDGLEEQTVFAPEHLQHARTLAANSMVLLKNKQELLPLNKTRYKNIAVIGPKDADSLSLLGAWQAAWNTEGLVSFTKGIKNAFSKSKVTYAVGVDDDPSKNRTEEEKALALAKDSDLVILTLGEGFWFAGENTSLVDPKLPDNQVALAKKIKALGKPVVIVLATGRPLVIPWVRKNFDTILLSWLPGTEAGNALADVLTGKVNPSGKLPITFPHHIGQAPISYLFKETGRPDTDKGNVTRYLDAPNRPAYPFGYGLSYTEFEYGPITLSSSKMKATDTITATITLSNIGKYDGAEVVQMYVRDEFASVTRPVKELKGFEKVFLEKGRSKTLTFKITEEQLKFFDQDLQYVSEPGRFGLEIGPSSDNTASVPFELIAE